MSEEAGEGCWLARHTAQLAASCNRLHLFGCWQAQAGSEWRSGQPRQLPWACQPYACFVTGQVYNRLVGNWALQQNVFDGFIVYCVAAKRTTLHRTHQVQPPRLLYTFV